MKKPRPVTVQQRRMFLLHKELGTYGKVARLLGTTKQNVHKHVKNYHKAIAARQEYAKWIRSYKPEINPITGHPNTYRPPKRQVNPETHYFSRLKDTEEGRKLRAKWSGIGGRRGSDKGIPNGYGNKIIEPIRKSAKRKAKNMVKKVAEELSELDKLAQEALETAAEIMKTPGSDAERLKASKVVLEFTHSKPTTKSEISVHKAEDFLASLVEDD